MYVPGNWVYQDGHYVWQAGYWAQGNDNYVWNQPYYSWTPSGYNYVDGYWDYPLEGRGLAFAPVRFDQLFWQTDPGWYYQPYFGLGAAGLLDTLFCWPSFNSYCFGDYYPGIYASRFGIFPWVGFGPRFFDPLFAFHAFHHHFHHHFHHGFHDHFHHGFDHALNARFWDRRDGVSPRPAHNFAGQQMLTRQAALQGQTLASGLHTLQPLNQISGMSRLTGSQLARQQVGARDFQRLSVQRRQVETAASARASNSTVSRSFQLPADARATSAAAALSRGATPGLRANASGARISNQLAMPGPPRPATASRVPVQGNRTMVNSASSLSRSQQQAVRSSSMMRAPEIHNLGPRSSVSHYQAPSAPHSQAPAASHFQAPAMNFSRPSFQHFAAPAWHGGGGGFHGSSSFHGGGGGGGFHGGGGGGGHGGGGHGGHR
jgi:hypothetical protein